EENETGDKVVDDVLQPKSDANAEGPRQNRNLGQIDPKSSQSHKETNEQNGIMQHRRDGIRNAPLKDEVTVNIFFQHKTDEARNKQRCPNGNDEGEDAAQRNTKGPYRYAGSKSRSKPGQRRTR